MEDAQRQADNCSAAKDGADTPRPAKHSDDLGMRFDDVVIIMACNERFAPYLSVAVQSVVEHANPQRNYELVVLANNLSARSMARLHAQATRTNVSIGFLDAAAAMGDVKLPRHGHFSLETYYRLLAPELLPQVNKAVYLDSDLVVLHDVAELFDTNVDGTLLAAVRDPDTAGQCGGYNDLVFSYLQDELRLPDPYGYFQGGVLVMNLGEFRRRYPTARMLQLAGLRHWRWLDQDVLNILAHGDYRRLDPSWNVLHDWQGIRRSRIVALAPDEVRREYEAARQNPKAVHYAGPDNRPWLYPACDMARCWWDHAWRSPFARELELALALSKRTPLGLLKRLQVFALFKVGMPLMDAALPPKSARREVLTRAFKKLTGSFI